MFRIINNSRKIFIVIIVYIFINFIHNIGININISNFIVNAFNSNFMLWNFLIWNIIHTQRKINYVTHYIISRMNILKTSNNMSFRKSTSSIKFHLILFDPTKYQSY